MMQTDDQRPRSISEIMKDSNFLISFFGMGILAGILLIVLPLFTQNNDNQASINNHSNTQHNTNYLPRNSSPAWKSPDINSLPQDERGQQIRYGRALVAQTAYYLGPKGIVMQNTNALNCQSCHLEAGTKILGNNYSAVAATYPKYRARSGGLEDIEKRVNDCMERSLNGTPLPSGNKELEAIKAYILWVGSEVPKKQTPSGAGIPNLPYLDRAANPVRGQLVYAQKCQRCHQADGQGWLNPDGNSYKYPPLWGEYSYNTAAGLYRLSRLAGFVKYNMPFGINPQQPELSDEQAWDVAAYINTQARPSKTFAGDFPKKEEKPVDHPFPPFADNFSPAQHKLGPFQPIKDFYAQKPK